VSGPVYVWTRRRVHYPLSPVLFGVCRDPRISGPAVGSYTERVSFNWPVLDRKRRPNWSVMVTLGRRITRAYGRPAPGGLSYNTISPPNV
jgi:hypothetical protein